MTSGLIFRDSALRVNSKPLISVDGKRFNHLIRDANSNLRNSESVIRDFSALQLVKLKARLEFLQVSIITEKVVSVKSQNQFKITPLFETPGHD